VCVNVYVQSIIYGLEWKSKLFLMLPVFEQEGLLQNAFQKKRDDHEYDNNLRGIHQLERFQLSDLSGLSAQNETWYN
jgi:hypothetical protein